MNGDARIGVFVQSWKSDFCVKNLMFLQFCDVAENVPFGSNSLKKNHCVECVEKHECSLLTGSFFAELANQFDLSCNPFCAHSF